ncbi:MAG: cyclic nucleotide-binding domain-containing protein [Burkholderiaceae bacterium]|nr:cyclic nucleotide-binding domain-containing protein [Burkholderiaceae bacterium]
MKGILGLLRHKLPPQEQQEAGESVFFSTAFADHGISADETVPWEARAAEVGAKRLAVERGAQKLRLLWNKDPHMKRLDAAAMDQLMHFFDFATVAPDREVMRQDEYGSFMIVLLSGSIAVDRDQEWGERVRLSEARPGEILGEMSLLDSGKRFSHCLTLTECEIAVLGAEALDEMMSVRAPLAASLIALLARKLSLRLRAVGARLTGKTTKQG